VQSYVRSSSVNDSLNDKCENLSENLAAKETCLKFLDEKNKSLYSENQQLKKDKIKI
jgi:cell shape-determining protein MreC